MNKVLVVLSEWDYWGEELVAFLAGRSTRDSRELGKRMIQVLEQGLRRCGW